MALHRVRSWWAVAFLLPGWVCCEAGVCVSVAAYRAPACGIGGVCGRPPRVYNAALQERRDGWSHATKTRIHYGDQSAQLTAIRAARPDQAVWSFSSQQATLRRLNKAFGGFFGRVKTAKPGTRAGYPRFKGQARFDSVEWPRTVTAPVAARVPQGVSAGNRPGEGAPAP